MARPRGCSSSGSALRILGLLLRSGQSPEFSRARGGRWGDPGKVPFGVLSLPVPGPQRMGRQRPFGSLRESREGPRDGSLARRGLPGRAQAERAAARPASASLLALPSACEGPPPEIPVRQESAPSGLRRRGAKVAVAREQTCGVRPRGPNWRGCLGRRVHSTPESASPHWASTALSPRPVCSGLRCSLLFFSPTSARAQSPLPRRRLGGRDAAANPRS